MFQTNKHTQTPCKADEYKCEKCSTKQHFVRQRFICVQETGNVNGHTRHTDCLMYTSTRNILFYENFEIVSRRNATKMDSKFTKNRNA